MKYTISINQKAIVDNNMALDIVDCAILDYVKDFALSPKTLRVTQSGLEYFWIQYEHFVQEMPLLGIKNKQSLGRRLSNLVDCGILDKTIIGGNRTYFRFWPRYDLVVSSEAVDSRVQGVDSKVQERWTHESRGGGLESPAYITDNSKPSTKKKIHNPFDVSLVIYFHSAKQESTQIQTILHKPLKQVREYMLDQVDEVRKMREIDMLNEAQILGVVKYAIEDSFWKTNVYSLSKFRKKDKNGAPYWSVFADRIRAVPKKMEDIPTL